MKNFIISAALLALVAIMGCGSSSSSDSLGQTRLLQLTDMPAETVARKSLDPNTPCSPLPLLRSGADLQRTPSFKSGHLYTQESVAFFPDILAAREVYTALTNETRTNCIIGNAKNAGRVSKARTAQGHLGEQEHELIFRLKKKHKRTEIQVSSLQQGRAVAALLLVANPGPLPRDEVERLLTTATTRMTHAKSP